MDIRNMISLIPISAKKKLELYGKARESLWKIKYNSQQYSKLKMERCFIPQNSYYGHEQWLKSYSGFKKSIRALIEHGMFFKCETDKIGWDVEWETGSIITFGDARFEALSKLYPDYNIIRIGPRIHYAPVDDDYLKELRSKIDANGRTMVLYPSHSLEKYKSNYNIDGFLNDALMFAKENGIINILVSLHPSDLLHGYDKEYKIRDSKLIPVTGGADQQKFLPRLKAILSIADITYSNNVGTHTGYSIYMNKPHIINIKSDSNDQDKPEFGKFTYSITDFQEEKNQFIKAFSGRDLWTITSEQRELIDYYFGISYIKTKEQMFSELEKCEKMFQQRFS